MRQLLLYAEDRLLEAFGYRLADHCGWSVRSAVVTPGRGALEKRLPKLNIASRTLPVLALVDRDRRGQCPGGLVGHMLPDRNPAMLLRYAVEEADAWVLADDEAFARFLGVSKGKLPNRPDSEIDPKQTLLNLALKARARDKRRIAPTPGTHASVGPAYNALLCPFVAREWSPERARRRSPSLDRCIAALHGLAG